MALHKALAMRMTRKARVLDDRPQEKAGSASVNVTL
jgi:hypothetical protein